MSDCCEQSGRADPAAVGTRAAPADAGCGGCGGAGRKVEAQTVLHHVRAEHLDRVGERAFRFCATPDCTVVYYGDGGTLFAASDLREPVTEKTSGPDRPVCYCFGFSEGDVREELARHGATTIPQRIGLMIKAGMCACEVRNPSGACCLGLVNKIVKQLAGGQECRPAAAAHDCCAP